MKTVLLGLLLVLSATVFAQTSAPGIQWQRSLGGSRVDFAPKAVSTSDGGYIVAGYSQSVDGDVTGHHGSAINSDFWIVKLSADGTIQWQKSLGGNSADEAADIKQTTDGGYIVVGYTYSTNGDVTGHHGPANNSDFWVVRLTAAGDIQWKKCFGGTYNEQATSVQVTGDGGYIIAGWSISTDGDVTGHHGIATKLDAWVVKLTSAGTIEWQKSLGGSGDDYAFAVQAAADGGYIIAGQSTSNDGDVSGHHGTTNNDSWIVKLTHNGTIEWQESLGGTDNDAALDIKLAGDGGYIAAGYSGSNDGDVTGNHGRGDYWIVKLSSTGSIQWQKCLGGSSSDGASGLEVLADGGYIVGGSSNSIDDDVTGNHGSTDFWIVKLNSTGNIVWEKSIGGSSAEAFYSIASVPAGGYITTGFNLTNKEM